MTIRFEMNSMLLRDWLATAKNMKKKNTDAPLLSPESQDIIGQIEAKLDAQHRSADSEDLPDIPGGWEMVPKQYQVDLTGKERITLIEALVLIERKLLASKDPIYEPDINIARDLIAHLESTITRL